MRLNPFHSFGGKIFFLSTFVALSATALISYDNMSFIREVLRNDFREESLTTAEYYGHDFDRKVKNLEFSLVNIAQYAANSEKEKIERVLQEIKLKHPSLKGISLVLVRKNKLTELVRLGLDDEKGKEINDYLGSEDELQNQAYLKSFPNGQVLLTRRLDIRGKKQQKLWFSAIMSKDFVGDMDRFGKNTSAFILDNEQVDLFTGKSYKKSFNKGRIHQKISSVIDKTNGTTFIENIEDAKLGLVSIVVFPFEGLQLQCDPTYQAKVIF